MKKFLNGFLALAIFSLSIVALSGNVEAGWNLRQNDDGTTDWVREDSEGSLDSVPIGGIHLNLLLENISSASTAMIISPITDAKISIIKSVIFSQITGSDAVLTFLIATGITDGGTAALTEVTNGTGRMTITACVNSTCSEGGATIDSFTPTSRNTLESGSVIVVNTSGASTNDVDAVLTITVVPR